MRRAVRCREIRGHFQWRLAREWKAVQLLLVKWKRARHGVVVVRLVPCAGDMTCNRQARPYRPSELHLVDVKNMHAYAVCSSSCTRRVITPAPAT